MARGRKETERVSVKVSTAAERREELVGSVWGCGARRRRERAGMVVFSDGGGAIRGLEGGVLCGSQAAEGTSAVAGVARIGVDDGGDLGVEGGGPVGEGRP